MSKTYTAQEMRNVAECLHYDNPTRFIIEAAAMLRQAADMMEREERRVRKYEYATTMSNGSPSQTHHSSHIFGYHAFRREVGEWEEVK